MSTADERLDAALGAAGGAKPDDAALDALAKAAREELTAHPKARPWWVDGLLVLGLNLVMGLGAAAMMSWSDTQHGSSTTKYLVATAWFLVMAAGSVWWLQPGARAPRWLVLGGFVLAAGLSVGVASGFDPGAPFFRGVSCALVECVVALAPLVLIFVLSLRFAARPVHLVTATLASGAGGALALHFHCGNGTFAHLAVFHVLPVVVLAGLAVLIRSRMRPTTFAP